MPSPQKMIYDAAAHASVFIDVCLVDGFSPGYGESVRDQLLEGLRAAEKEGKAREENASMGFAVNSLLFGLPVYWRYESPEKEVVMLNGILTWKVTGNRVLVTAENAMRGWMVRWI